MTDGNLPSNHELAELFEAIWLVSELVAASDDRHMVPFLVEQGEDVLAWLNQRSGTPAETCFAAEPASRLPPPGVALLDEEGWQAACHRFARDVEKNVARQQAIALQLERAGRASRAEPARALLRVMQSAKETAHHMLRAAEARS